MRGSDEMARGWAERETFAARGPVDPRNCQTVQESRSYLLLRNDTISTQTGKI
jgi:hypothetical protein